MKPRHIFHHPVGTFPTAARWYLACIAVFTLLCLAIHLSIQTDAQQRAELLVQAWAKKADVQINHIHYHLLRNALILKDIHAKKGNDSIAIKHLLLRTNPESLNSPKPQIREVEISGIEAEFHLEAENHAWQQNQPLMNVWQATSSLQAQNGHIKLYLQEHASPLVLHNISIQQYMQSNKRTITASASLYHGSLQWQLHSNRHNNKSKGTFSWKHVSTQQLMDALALNPMDGYLNGALTWRQSMDTAAQHSRLNLKGETHFSTANITSENGDNKRPSPRLHFSAAQRAKTWNIDINARAWPLAAWTSFIPSLDKRQIISARIDGSGYWQGRSGAWKINGSKGVVHDIVFASLKQRDVENIRSDAWSWHEIQYDSFNIDTRQQDLHISRMIMNDGNLTLKTHTSAETIPSQQNDQIRTPPKIWNITVDDARVRDMTLVIKLPDGDLKLQSLSGQYAWPKQQPLSFNLATSNPNDSSDPQWRLRGKITGNEAKQLAEAEIAIHAEHIPITSMRPLLPLQIDANSPVTLKGTMNMKSNVSVQQGIWRMQGKLRASNIQISHAGDIWMADQINTNFGPVGMALDVQNIDQINVENWLYIAALQPLQANPQEQLGSPAYQPSWWASALRNKDIYIHQLKLHNGAVSIGKKESLWAQSFDIQMYDLAPNTQASINATAKIGGGLFTLNGEWNAISEPPRFIGSASLQHATPFFLHSWMAASGMPRLVRGYMNAQLDIDPTSEPDSYQSRWQLELLRTSVEKGQNNPTDPMLTRTGLNTENLIQHLEQISETITLQNSISGLWKEHPLNYDMIGRSFQNTLSKAALVQPHPQQEADQAVGKQKSSNTSLSPVREPSATDLNAHIRLHGKGVLSSNERSRLFKVVRFLRTRPEITIDLVPHWSGDKLDNDLIARIQHSQDLIIRYMVHRNIDKQRVFPRWPVTSDHVEEISSIRIELNP